jgi:hypothetical protein
MGIFFEPRRVQPTVVQPALENALRDAYLEDRPVSGADALVAAGDRAEPVLAYLPDELKPEYKPLVVDALREALNNDPPPLSDASKAAAEKASKVMVQVSAGGEFKTGRFIGALVIFAVIVGGAAGADAAGLPDSSKALYGFAATIFGLVVGLLGGEKTA